MRHFFALLLAAAVPVTVLVRDHSEQRALVPAHTGERTFKVYPGYCGKDQSWYLVEASEDSATLGCWDPDYTEPDPQ